jgi:hypothetical protein
VQISKPVNLLLLEKELAAASVSVGRLGTSGELTETPGVQDLFTYDENGMPVDLPPEAGPVVDAHVAPPLVVEYVETREVRAVTRTTDGAFKEVWRLTTQAKHVYRAALEIRATDATDGTTKAQEARLVFKGLASSVVQVGATAALWMAQDAAASAWAIQVQVQGVDLVFGVRGAAGKTVDWSLDGAVVIFASEGLAEG